MRHFLACNRLDLSEIRHLLEVAEAFRKPVMAGETVPLLSGKTVANLFFENSTRTRLSFEQATRRLGGSVVNFASGGSSVSKGETLLDTAQNILAMKPHCIVLRHSCAGSPEFLARILDVPILNAGDGFHEHPSQALLDAFTIQEKLGDLKGKKVVIVGDIAHSRVARSNIQVLTKMGARVAVCGPPTFLPPRVETMGVEYSYRIEPLLKDADVVMCLRIQFERQNRMQIPSTAEYAKFWGLNRERAEKMKPGAIVLHPGPVNRGVELDPEVADGPRSVILDQVFNGILVRMAILAWVSAPEALETWWKKER